MSKRAWQIFYLVSFSFIVSHSLIAISLVLVKWHFGVITVLGVNIFGVMFACAVCYILYKFKPNSGGAAIVKFLKGEKD